MSTTERRNPNLLLHVSNFLPVLLLLAGCGGGGSGGSDGPQPGTNAAPVAQNDSASTQASTPITIDVLTNDSDSDGTIVPNSVTLVKLPARGSINNNRDGTITYTPNAGFSGATDSFSYTVADDDGAVSNEATVSITVILANTPPTVENACGTTPQDIPFTSDLSLLVSDQEDSVFQYSITQPATNGTAELDMVTGALTYTPNPNFKGEDTFIYEVKDPSGKTASGEIKVVVGDTLIMPLGDSITAGIIGSGHPLGTIGSDPLVSREQSTRIGYRKKLHDDLNNPAVGGFQVDFVGDNHDGQGPGAEIVDDDHMGFPGETTAQVGAKLKQWLTNNNNDVDVILMHLGSNDVNKNSNAETFDSAVSVQNAEAILNNIDGWELTHHPVTVFLALITDRETQAFPQFPRFPELNPNVEALNEQLDIMAQGRIKAGDKIIVVNQHDALTYPDDLKKSSEEGPEVQEDFLVHPNQGGYNKMADTWLKRLETEEAAIPRCEPTAP